MTDNLVTVAGERVSLTTDSGIPKTEQVIVNLNDKYIPTNLSSEEKSQVSLIYKKVFSSHTDESWLSIFNGKTPAPPCDNNEKNLLMKTLSFRYDNLRSEINSGINSSINTIRLRTTEEHAIRLKTLIDFLSTAQCNDEKVDSSTNPCDEIDNMTDEDVRKMLRHFLMLLLQGKNPLGENGEILSSALNLDSIFNLIIKQVKDSTISDTTKLEILYGYDVKPEVVKEEDILTIVDRLLSYVRDLEAKIEKISAEISEYNNINGKNDSEIRRLKIQIQDLTQQLNACSASKNVSELASKACVDAESRIAVLNDKILQLQNENNSLKTAITQLTKDQSAFNKELSRLNTELTKMTLETNKIRGDLGVANTEITSLKQQLELLRKEKEDLLSQMGENSNTKIQGLTQQISEKDAQIQSINDRLTELTDSNKNQTREISELKLQLGVIEPLKVSLQNQITDLSGQLIKCKEEGGLKDDRITLLQTEFDKLKIELDTLTIKEKEIQEQLIKSNLSNNEKQDEIDTLKLRISSLVSWLNEGADTSALPDNLDEIKDPIVSVLDSLKTVSTGTGAKSDIRTNYCFLLFFLSYTMKQHFPTGNEKEAILLNEILNGKNKQFEKGTGYFSADSSANKEKNLVSLLVSVLDVIQNQNNKIDGIYTLEFMNAEQLSSLKKLITIIKAIVSKNPNLLSDMTDYMTSHGGLEIPSIKFDIVDNNGLKPVLAIGNNDENRFKISVKGEEPVKSNDNSLSLSLSSLDNSSVLNFPMLFYLYIFALREYFNTISSELKKGGCPLPAYLQKKKL